MICSQSGGSLTSGSDDGSVWEGSRYPGPLVLPSQRSFPALPRTVRESIHYSSRHEQDPVSGSRVTRRSTRQCPPPVTRTASRTIWGRGVCTLDAVSVQSLGPGTKKLRREGVGFRLSDDGIKIRLRGVRDLTVWKDWAPEVWRAEGD